MKRHIVSAAAGLWFCLLAPGMAQQSEPGVVVELYTSQGCSSCPPADALLADLAKKPGVIALALHVDYWDYIGWADTFGQAQFTARQKAYARANGSKMVYTPQMIIGGGERVVGNEPGQVNAAVKRLLGTSSPVTLTLERRGNRVVIRAEADPPLKRGTRVQLVRYQPSKVVEIQRGENAGESISYANIVTDWQPIAEWSGKAPLEMQAAAPGNLPVVVIIQSDGPAEILAAARIR